jgi:hypothetical protein
MQSNPLEQDLTGGLAHLVLRRTLRAYLGRVCCPGIPEGKDRLPATRADDCDRAPAEAGPKPSQQAQDPDSIRPDTLTRMRVQHLDRGRWKAFGVLTRSL